MVVARLPAPRDADPPGERAELLRVRVDNGMVETIRSLTDRPRPGPRPVGRGGLDRHRSRGREPLLLDRRRGSAAPDQLVPPPRRLGLQEVLRCSTSRRRWARSRSRPIGRTLAARIGSIDRLSAPAFCDLESPDLRTWLIAPDDESRVEWIATLVALGPDDPRRPARPLDRPQEPPRRPASSGPRSCRSRANSRRTPSRPTGSGGSAGWAARSATGRPRPRPPRPSSPRSSTRPACSSTTSARITPRPWAPSRRWRSGPTRPIGGSACSGSGPRSSWRRARLDRAGQTIAYLREQDPKPAHRLEATGSGYKLTAEPLPGRGWPDLSRAEGRGDPGGPPRPGAR